jgi:leucyl/phenylalanyl-tRNA--protein transferase
VSFDAEDLLECYARGVFPMADSRDDEELFLVDPERRGVLPLDRFHVPRRLARTVRADLYEVRFDTAFDAVVAACAEPRPGHPETWINTPIRQLYGRLHRMGRAHSVECWSGDELVGGLYGVSLRAAFFGESMFSRARDASKVALVHLVARLITGGYRLLDTQFLTEHLTQFGTEEISRVDYRRRLARALALEARFHGVGRGAGGEETGGVGRGVADGETGGAGAGDGGVGFSSGAERLGAGAGTGFGFGAGGLAAGGAGGAGAGAGALQVISQAS